MPSAWTAGKALPGGDIDGMFDDFVADLVRDYPALARELVIRYARLYGTRARELLSSARTSTDLGRHFGGDFYEREASYLRDTEWATRAEDVLERRTKHGLHLTAAQREAFKDHLGK